MRLFASLDFHCNNGLNTEVQEKNKTKRKKIQRKVVDSMIFGIHCNASCQ